MDNTPGRREDRAAKGAPAGGSGPRGTSGAPAPKWLWALVLGGFALMFWKFVPTPFVPVPYAPWFLDQVEADNIKGLLIRGDEIRGEVRRPAMYRSAAPAHDERVTRFLTHAPAPDCLAPVVAALRQAKAGREPVVIEAEPVSPLGELSWLLLLLPSILLLIMTVQLRVLVERAGRPRGESPPARARTGPDPPPSPASTP